jgi:hypothetical protein
VSSQGPPILPPISGKGARKIAPLHPSHPIVRRPGADLEEKREPRVASSAEAQKGRRHEQTSASLTPAAIEKRSFATFFLKRDMEGALPHRRASSGFHPKKTDAVSREWRENRVAF